jgi:hypothetical protein
MFPMACLTFSSGSVGNTSAETAVSMLSLTSIERISSRNFWMGSRFVTSLSAASIAFPMPQDSSLSSRCLRPSALAMSSERPRRVSLSSLNSKGASIFTRVKLSLKAFLNVSTSAMPRMPSTTTAPTLFSYASIFGIQRLAIASMPSSFLS